jgi:ADP-heptose:LPS heptosyltransferase
MPEDQRVLVVRFSSLGDVVLTTPLLRAIRAHHPNAAITVVANAHYTDLLAGNPAVARMVPVSPRESASAIASRLGTQPCQAAIDLQDSLRSRRLRRTLAGVGAS